MDSAQFMDASIKQEFEERFFRFWKAPRRRYILLQFSSQFGYFPTATWSEGACCLAAEALRRWFAAYGIAARLFEARGKYNIRRHTLIEAGATYWDTKRIGPSILFEQAELYPYLALADVLEDYDFEESLCSRVFLQLIEELGEPPIELYASLPKQDPLFPELPQRVLRPSYKKRWN